MGVVEPTDPAAPAPPGADLVERLRDDTPHACASAGACPCRDVRREAADEIEQLRSALRAARRPRRVDDWSDRDWAGFFRDARSA